MSHAVRRVVWESRARVFGADAPTTRAAFGRYVAARGGYLSPVSSGEYAWVANVRGLGQLGFHNRAHRRHLGTRPLILGPRGEVTAL